MGRLGRVLVVDDDEAVRLRVRDLLESAGSCEVNEAANGAEGLDAVARHPPDLILLDLMMPGMSGLEVCTTLRRDPSTHEIPIIVLSAAHEEEARPAALGAGAEDYLCKPIPAQELRAKVANIMRLNRYHALKQERDRLRWLFENSREALVRVTRSGRLREANQVAHLLFGLPIEPPAHQSDLAPDALALIALHYRPDPPDALERLRTSAPLPENGFALHRPECTLLTARWLQVDIHQDADTPSADLLLKFTDHSDLVHRHLETWSFQHLISHKIRTPLNGVGATLDLLLETPGMLVGDEGRELIQAARDSSRRLEDTLLSILRYHEALCSPVAKNSPAVSVSWELLLREAAADAGLAPALLRLIGDPAPALPAGLVAPMRLVLAELVENYLKFSQAERSGLEARLSHPADSPASLRLFAPGPALAPETIARLGLPYWQLEKKFTGEIPGMGLGLATSRLLLRSLGAELVFSASTRPEGLVATITLPPRP